jgi:hypothetical protein
MYNSIELLKKLEYSKTLEAFELFYFPAEITLERHRASIKRHRASILKNNSWSFMSKVEKTRVKCGDFPQKTGAPPRFNSQK